MTDQELRRLCPFERAVLEKLLAGSHPVLELLRRQLEVCLVEKREDTGHGFFTRLRVPRGSAVAAPLQRAQVRDVGANIQGLDYGAGFVVFVKDGYLDLLEGFSYDEEWPIEVIDFELEFQRGRIIDPANVDLGSG